MRRMFSENQIKSIINEDIENESISLPIEKIIDDAGNKRFIEGTFATTDTNITDVYNRWSLSGTHLMIVCSGTIEAGVTASAGVKYNLELPEWILNKIYGVWGNLVEIKQFVAHDAGLNTNVNINTVMTKLANKITISFNSNVTHATYKIAFRLQYDLVIDAD